MNDYDFTIPLENIAVYVNQTNTFYCQTQIALITQDQNTVVLGGAFYTAFVGIFDVENDKIGFAESTRALPGSSLLCTTCSSSDGQGGTRPPLPGTVPNEPSDGKSNVKLIVLIAAIVVVCVLVCLGVVYCRKKGQEEQEHQSKKVNDRKARGKKGYTLQEEKEDDSDGEDPNHYATLNN